MENPLGRPLIGKSRKKKKKINNILVHILSLFKITVHNLYLTVGPIIKFV